MIVIDGKKYAESVAEMVDSLFNDGEGTLEILPAVLKKELAKAKAAYKTPAETQKNSIIWPWSMVFLIIK